MPSTPGRERAGACKRWLSALAYGLFTGTLFRARTAPQTLRARFERFGQVSRAAIQRKPGAWRGAAHHKAALGQRGFIQRHGPGPPGKQQRGRGKH